MARLSEWNEKPIANGSAFNDKGELTRSSLVLTEAKVREIEEAIQSQMRLSFRKDPRLYRKAKGSIYYIYIATRSYSKVALDSQTYNAGRTTFV